MIILGCMKLGYYCDREQSMNTRVEPRMVEWKSWVQKKRWMNTWAPYA